MPSEIKTEDENIITQEDGSMIIYNKAFSTEASAVIASCIHIASEDDVVLLIQDENNMRAVHPNFGPSRTSLCATELEAVENLVDVINANS